MPAINRIRWARGMQTSATLIEFTPTLSPRNSPPDVTVPFRFPSRSSAVVVIIISLLLSATRFKTKMPTDRATRTTWVEEDQRRSRELSPLCRPSASPQSPVSFTIHSHSPSLRSGLSSDQQWVDTGRSGGPEGKFANNLLSTILETWWIDTGLILFYIPRFMGQ